MSAWVYRAYDYDGRLIYVGATADLGTRLDQHRDRSWWAPQVVKVRAHVYPDVATARTVEAHAIAAEKPRWNIRGRSRDRFGWSSEDYHDYVLARSMGRNICTSWTATHLRRIAREHAARFGRELAVALPT